LPDLGIKTPSELVDLILRMAGESVQIIWGSMRLRTLFPALFLLFREKPFRLFHRSKSSVRR